jgi:ribosomal protein L11 methyltransferase
MNYVQINFTFQGDASLVATARELLPDAATEAGLESFVEQDGGLTGYAPKLHFDEEELRRQLDDLLPGVTVSYTLQTVEDRDWNASWEEGGFDEIDIDGRVLIYDARRGRPSVAGEPSEVQPDILIGIQAVQAFGTGTHQTTQMVIHALLQHDLRGQRMLDCGCGTGILGIAASKLGAREVVAFDVDEWSVENARTNAERNHVVNLQVLLGDASVLSHVSGLFDVVTANINRNVLLHDLQAYQEVMSHGAMLVLSGFYETDIPLLLDRAGELGLTETVRYSKDDWRCLVLRNGDADSSSQH